MTITLTATQMAWLERFAAEQGFATLDEAAQALIAQAMMSPPPGFEDPDPQWVIPLIEDAEKDIVEGRVVSHAQVKEQLRRRIRGAEG